MKEKVLKYIKRNHMLSKGESVVAGVSGGSDSMCLLSLLLEIKDIYDLNIYVVHIHHGIRGKDADMDMEYVENFCKLHRIKCFSYIYDIIGMAKEKKLSTEEMGRIVRYEKFNEIAEKYNAKIAVAHNISDNVETVLFNMFRGSGIKGLAGISPARDRIIRPVMCLTKDEIYSYLEENHIQYRVDKSNFTDEYTRNKIRLQILPYITENINERAIEHINETADYMAEVLEYIEEEAGSLYSRYVSCMERTADRTADKSGDEIRGFLISKEAFNCRHILVAEVIRMCIHKAAGQLKDITRVHIESIFELSGKNVGAKINLPYGVIAIKKYEGVAIICEDRNITGNNRNIRRDMKNTGNGREESTEENSAISDKGMEKQNVFTEIIIDDYGVYDIKGHNEKISLTPDTFTEDVFWENMYTKWINYDILKNSLSLRNRQTGDYIVIDDKGSRKKLKDFFIDKKIPRENRDSILLLAKGHEIVWIVGYRLSAKYKVNENSKNIIRVDIMKATKDAWRKNERED